jgi:heme/copper-type cytochrome/quinol oxidase subunit 2
VEEVAQRLLTMIEQLADQMGIAAERVIPYLIEREMYAGVASLVIRALVIAVLTTVAVLVYRQRSHLRSDEDKAMLSILTWVVWMSIVLILVGSSYNAIISVAAPEGAVLHDLITRVLGPASGVR